MNSFQDERCWFFREVSRRVNLSLFGPSFPLCGVNGITSPPHVSLKAAMWSLRPSSHTPLLRLLAAPPHLVHLPESQEPKPKYRPEDHLFCPRKRLHEWIWGSDSSERRPTPDGPKFASQLFPLPELSLSLKTMMSLLYLLLTGSNQHIS